MLMTEHKILLQASLFYIGVGVDGNFVWLFNVVCVMV